MANCNYHCWDSHDLSLGLTRIGAGAIIPPAHELRGEQAYAAPFAQIV